MLWTRGSCRFAKPSVFSGSSCNGDAFAPGPLRWENGHLTVYPLKCLDPSDPSLIFMPRSQRTASQARIWHLQHLALAQGWLRQASCLCVTQAVRFSDHWRILELAGAMWPLLWATVRAYAPYVTFPVAFVVGAVGYHLEWFIRGQPPPPALEDEKSISERREDRTLQESAGKDLTQVVSLKEKMEFAPRAVLNRNRPEKN